ncbi:MAG: FtsX-like permease family protein [Cytophagales bacterium]|nr:FtsX-like permease family protein [Cytophagales bacterium]
MIKFLFKGILRDRSRSTLPIIIISLGVFLTILLSGYIRGMLGDMVVQNANMDTGHVKIMTRAYAENKEQLPNDLGLLEVEELKQNLALEYPNLDFTPRIKFGGLMDAPDENGETKGQGPVAGIALDLFHQESGEAERMNLKNSLISGSIPDQAREVLLGHEFTEKLGLSLGDEITFVGSTINGSMTFQNFVISGTIKFGSPVMDRGAMLIDISDAQQMLDMPNGAGELLGFLKSNSYFDEEATEIANDFNTKYSSSEDEFSSVMYTLKQQNNLASLLDIMDSFSAIFIFIFILAMSIVLWNTGLLGGLRRYNEFGIRLALGESKGAIYRTLIYEAILIGAIGSTVGTALGIAATYYWQITGLDISSMTKNAGILMPSIIRAKVTPDLFYIGFIPGLLAMLFGNMLSGIGIYKRETATLFKELEV